MSLDETRADLIHAVRRVNRILELFGSVQSEFEEIHQALGRAIGGSYTANAELSSSIARLLEVHDQIPEMSDEVNLSAAYILIYANRL